MQKDYNEQSLDKRCMSTVQLLIDIENLAHADYMTGTLNSGIPYLIEVCACPRHIPLPQPRGAIALFLGHKCLRGCAAFLLSSRMDELTLAEDDRSTWHVTHYPIGIGLRYL